MKKNYLIILALILMVTGITACKKTIGLDPLPANFITQFKVSSLDGDIYGAITESDKTITVYLPAYFKLSVIDPEIKVSTGATLKTEVIPVALTNTTTTYTVVGADQSTSTYKLKIVVQQETPLYISSQTAEYSAPYTSLTVGGNFYAANMDDIHVTMVNAAGQETAELQPYLFGKTYVSEGGLYYLNGLAIPATIAEGSYYVKVRVFGLTATGTTPLEIKFRQPGLNITTITAKAGANFTFFPTTGTIFKNFTSLTGVIDGVTYNFPIVSQSETTATASVPTNLAPGRYLVTLTGTFTGFANASVTALLVTE